MTSIRIGTVVLAGLLVTMMGCNSSTDSGGGVAAAGTLVFTLDGTAYDAGLTNSARSTGSFAIYTRTSTLRVLTIRGVIASPMRRVTVSTVGLTQAGTVTLGPSGTPNGSLVYEDSLSVGAARAFCTYPTVTGTVTVTKFDTTAMLVSGTFSGSVQQYKPNGVTGTAVITAGAFTDLPLIMQ